METYKELKGIVSKQMKGSRLYLFFWLFLIAFVFSIGRNILVLHMHSRDYMYLSYALSMVYIFINDAILFLYIKRVREETFHKSDLVHIYSMSPYLLLVTLIISFIQMTIFNFLISMNMTLIFLYIATSITTLILLLWNAVVAYAIYDGNTSIKELLLGSVGILVVGAKMISRFSIYYLSFFVLMQFVIFYMFDMLQWNDVSTNIILIVRRAMNEPTLILSGILIIYILNYTIEYALLVPIYLVIANIYDKKRASMMPLGKRFNIINTLKEEGEG